MTTIYSPAACYYQLFLCELNSSAEAAAEVIKLQSKSQHNWKIFFFSLSLSLSLVFRRPNFCQ